MAKLGILKVFNSSESIFLKEIFLQGKRIIWLTYINEIFLAHVKDFIELLQATPQKSWFPLECHQCGKNTINQIAYLLTEKKEKKIKQRKKSKETVSFSTFFTSLKEFLDMASYLWP